VALSEHSTRSVTQEIERTGLFRSPPSMRGKTSLRADPIQLLAGAESAEEVLRAAVGYFARIFREVLALGVHKGRALSLMAGNQKGLRAVAEPVQLPLTDGTVVRSVLDRPQVAYRRTGDASLAALCSSVGMSSSNLTLIPAFDYGRPAFIIIGQGLEEWQLRERFGQIKSFVGKVSKALHIVTLRSEIVMGERPDARLGAQIELYAQAQARGCSDVRIMSVRNISTGGVFLEGSPEQYPELKPGAAMELVIFGFEDGGDDEPQFNIECRAEVVRVDARATSRRSQGFVVNVNPVDQANRDRLTALVLRNLAYRPTSDA
jgi:hypothetical protein